MATPPTAEDVSGPTFGEGGARPGEPMLGSVLDSLHEAVVACDAAGRITVVNEAARDLHGHAMAPLPGGGTQGCCALYLADGLTRLSPDEVPLARALKGDRPADLHLVLAPAGLPARCLVLNGGPITDVDGVVAGAVVTYRDVTERRPAGDAGAEALRRSEERFRDLVASAPVAIYGTDLDGRVIIWNSASTEVFGWTQEEVIGRPLPMVDRLHEGESEVVLARVSQGEHLDIETRRLRKDESEALLALSVAPLRDEDGNIVGTLRAVVDLTERSALEAQLRHAQKLDAVGRLAGGVAHDFNNILTAVLGYSELALRHTEEGSAVRSFVSHIAAAAETGADLTGQLMAFSRREPEARPEVLDLASALERSVGLVRRLIGEDIALDVRVGAPPPVLLTGSHLDQIIVNLAVNARDAMPGGGCIVVSADRVTVDATTSTPHAVPVGTWALLCFTDTGSGMSESTRARCLDPFFTTKAPGSGTGLGLSIVHGVVTGAGGRLVIDSAPGKGSTVRVYLPAAADSPAETVSAAPPASAAAHGGGQTVLLVEDDVAIRTLAAKVLTDAGYRVLAAADGPSALSLAAASPAIDAVVSDLVMPGMGGLELVERLSADRERLAVLLVSGYGTTEDDEAPKLGYGMLAKPFSPADLLRALSLQLSREGGDGGVRP